MLRLIFMQNISLTGLVLQHHQVQTICSWIVVIHDRFHKAWLVDLSAMLCIALMSDEAVKVFWCPNLIGSVIQTNLDRKTCSWCFSGKAVSISPPCAPSCCHAGVTDGLKIFCILRLHRCHCQDWQAGINGSTICQWTAPKLTRLEAQHFAQHFAQLLAALLWVNWVAGESIRLELCRHAPSFQDDADSSTLNKNRPDWKHKTHTDLTLVSAFKLKDALRHQFKRYCLENVDFHANEFVEEDFLRFFIAALVKLGQLRVRIPRWRNKPAMHPVKMHSSRHWCRAGSSTKCTLPSGRHELLQSRSFSSLRPAERLRRSGVSAEAPKDSQVTLIVGDWLHPACIFETFLALLDWGRELGSVCPGIVSKEYLWIRRGTCTSNSDSWSDLVGGGIKGATLPLPTQTHIGPSTDTTCTQTRLSRVTLLYNLSNNCQFLNGILQVQNSFLERKAGCWSRGIHRATAK